MKPQFLSPQQGVYTFEEADAILAMAESKGMAVHGHTIAFTEAMPRWMQELPSGTEPERQSSADALLDYVTTVVTHFKGRLDSLDVVNEPFDVDQGTSFQQNIWYRVFGPATRRSSPRPSTTPIRTSCSSSTRTGQTCRAPTGRPAQARAGHQRAGRAHLRRRPPGPRLRPQDRRHLRRRPHRYARSLRGRRAARPHLRERRHRRPRDGRPGEAIRHGAGHLPALAGLRLLHDVGRGRPLRLVDRRQRRPAAGPRLPVRRRAADARVRRDEARAGRLTTLSRPPRVRHGCHRPAGHAERVAVYAPQRRR